MGASTDMKVADVEKGDAKLGDSPSDDYLTGDVSLEGGLQRKLHSRHVQMIAIGGCIGTGLFIGSGKALHTGGPLSLSLAFILIGICLTIMMQGLGEMTVVFPVTGSFTRYATRFIDPALGFAVGWQYWLCWVAVFGAEASAFVILINYWNDDPRFTPLWISIFVVINLAIHFCSVRVFGEIEFWVSAIKVVAVITFIITVWCIMGGAGPTGKKHGTEYWHLPGLENGVYNGFKGMASVFVTAAFATGGTETIGVVSGEAVNPRHSIPRAIRTLMWRIFIFYVASTTFLTFVVRYDNDHLIGGSNASSSPFVLAIRDAGISVLPNILNAVLIVCVCSVGSNSIYLSSRTLKGLAEDGFAFGLFSRTDSRGRPYMAVAFTGSIGIVLSYLNCSTTGATVFSWFSSISGMAFFIVWLSIIASNWRFRMGLKAQNDNALYERFAFRQALFPWLSILAFVVFAFMVICELIVSIWPIGESPNASTFFSNYIGVPIFLLMWGGYKLVCRTKVVKLEEMDLQTGRRDVSPEELAVLEKYANMSWREKVKSYVHF